MNWKSFLKPTLSKIILLLIFGFIGFLSGMSNINPIIDYIFGVSFRLGAIIHHQVFGTDYGFQYFSFSFLLFYSYLLSCVVVGFFFAIKNKESKKIPAIALVILIIIVCGTIFASFQAQKYKSYSFLISQGFIPILNTKEKCLSKGFLWSDIGSGSGNCYNKFTKEECQVKGYFWNKCVNINTDFMTDDSPLCTGKCIIK